MQTFQKGRDVKRFYEFINKSFILLATVLYTYNYEQTGLLKAAVA